MDFNLKYDAKAILDREFAGKKPGYDPLQVDSFLDEILKDYLTFNQYHQDAENTISELTRTNKLLKERLDQIEVTNAVLNEKLKSLEGSDNSSSLGNIDLLKRISALEQALFKQGIDPNEIK